MKELAALFSIVVCTCSLTFPQTHATKSKLRQGAARTDASNKSSSTVALSLSSVVKDHRGGVWITGTAFLLAGLMVNDRNGIVRPVVVPDVKIIRDPIFVTAEIGWMNGRQYLYRTIDGGLSWQKRWISGVSKIGTIHFGDSQNGWVGGSSGEIYRTTDGGQTWKRAELPFKYEIKQIQFVDLLHGWAIGFSLISTQKTMRALFRSNDGGETWQVMSNGDADEKGSVESFFFLDEQNGWGIEGWQHNIIRTQDGGNTWTIQEVYPKNSWNLVFFQDDLHGWAIGHGIAHTSDGGATWNYQVDPETSHAYFEGITFIDEKHGWAVGSDKVLRTEDGGETWRPLPEDWKRLLPSFHSLNSQSKERRQR